jgi:hypothetical protein
VADWLGDILVVPIGSADVEEREVGSEFRRAIKLDGRLRATLDFVAGPADQSSQGLCQAAVDSPRTSVNNRTRSTNPEAILGGFDCSLDSRVGVEDSRHHF